VKTALQIRNEILTVIPDLIGIRYYGATVVEPAILMLPDRSLEDSGMTFPSIINGQPVKYIGVEVVFYRYRKGDDFTPYLNSQSGISQKTWVLLKDHGNIDNLSLSQINDYRAAATYNGASANLQPITEEMLDEALSYASAKVAKLLSLYRKLSPPDSTPDQVPLLDGIILESEYAGYL
jgi:hypothetical protein